MSWLFTRRRSTDCRCSIIFDQNHAVWGPNDLEQARAAATSTDYAATVLAVNQPSCARAIADVKRAWPKSRIIVMGAQRLADATEAAAGAADYVAASDQPAWFERAGCGTRTCAPPAAKAGTGLGRSVVGIRRLARCSSEPSVATFKARS